MDLIPERKMRGKRLTKDKYACRYKQNEIGERIIGPKYNQNQQDHGKQFTTWIQAMNDGTPRYITP